MSPVREQISDTKAQKVDGCQFGSVFKAHKHLSCFFLYHSKYCSLCGSARPFKVANLTFLLVPSIDVVSFAFSVRHSILVLTNCLRLILHSGNRFLLAELQTIGELVIFSHKLLLSLLNWFAIKLEDIWLQSNKCMSEWTEEKTVLQLYCTRQRTRRLSWWL